MQNVKAVITFTLETDNGEQMHKSTLEFNGLDEERVLSIEEHFIGFLGGMHAESAEFVSAEKAEKQRK